MITEDYVSFEVAKLLKEKGFNPLECGVYYSTTTGKRTTELLTSLIACPTHQRACKWLREKKKLVISIDLNYSDNSYSYSIDSIIEHRIVGYGLGGTYEEAVEEALKYTLENLI